MKRYIVPGLIVFLLLAPQSQGEEQTVVRFSLPEVAPWAQVDENGEAYGLLVDLVEKLEAVSGVPLSYHVRPYPRVHRELERGEADFTFMFDFPEAEDKLQSSGEVITLRTLVLGTQEASVIDSLNDLQGKKVGYIRGAYYSEKFLSHEGLEQVPVRDFRHGLELLDHGRIAAIVSGEMAVISEYKPEEDPPLRVLMDLPRSEGHLFFSRASSHKEIQRLLSEALENLRSEGELDRLLGERLNDKVLLEATR